MNTLIPTHRRGIDVTWKCNVKCSFCYYKHDNLKDAAHMELKDIQRSILQAKIEKNTYVDLVGPGEPTTHPQIADIVAFCKKNKLKVCINTNGIIPENKLIEIIKSGVDDFLISIHGMQNTHNDIVGIGAKAWQIQQKTINVLKEHGKTFRANCVITDKNSKELIDIAKYLITQPVRICNFINFNPHNKWMEDPESCKYVANLKETEPYLNEAIDILELAGIGVNVRYYPMCRIREDLRKNICNNLQVMFDPYEWDYNIVPKTIDAFTAHGNMINNVIATKNGDCAECDLKNICGGINKYYKQFLNQTQTTIIRVDKNVNKNDAHWYRKHNDMVMRLI